MGLRSYFGSVINAVTLYVTDAYASGKLYHGKGVQSYGVGTGSVVGNARGTGANDLQTTRTGATQVASGTNASVLGGANNIASGAQSAAMGTNCTASATGAMSLGLYNVVSGFYAGGFGGANNAASGTYAVALGGDYGTASASYALVTGSRAKADHYGEQAHATGYFAANGDAQTSRVVWRGTTTNAVATEVFLDGISQRFTLADDSTYGYELTIVGRRTDVNGESALYVYHGIISRDAGVTAMVSSAAKTILETTAAWNAVMDADTTNHALRIMVTGEAAKTIYWVASARIIKITG